MYNDAEFDTIYDGLRGKISVRLEAKNLDDVVKSLPLSGKYKKILLESPKNVLQTVDDVGWLFTEHVDLLQFNVAGQTIVGIIYDAIPRFSSRFLVEGCGGFDKQALIHAAESYIDALYFKIKPRSYMGGDMATKTTIVEQLTEATMSQCVTCVAILRRMLETLEFNSTRDVVK